jgi:bacterioferritin-associated ferredoxin
MDYLFDKSKCVGCVCFQIPYDEIIEMIKEHNPNNVKDIQKICPLGKRCGMCVPYVNRYIKESKNV